MSKLVQLVRERYVCVRVAEIGKWRHWKAVQRDENGNFLVHLFWEICEKSEWAWAQSAEEGTNSGKEKFLQWTRTSYIVANSLCAH